MNSADTTPNSLNDGPGESAWVGGILSWLTWGVLVCLLTVAAWLRFTLPAVPFADPDTWGYLCPGLKWFGSGVFEQANGRSFFYPLFVAVLLKTTGSFSSIPLVQHGLGVGSGLIWWMLWRGFVRWLPPGFSRSWIAPFLGLAGLAVYLLGAQAIYFEHAIRPEGVFPFFALAHLAALFGCVRRVLEGTGWVLAGLGALALSLDGVLLSLKPSWGFAFLVAPAVLAGCFFLRNAKRNRPALAAAFGLGFVAVCVLHGMIPRALQWKPDTTSRLFLPQTLVSVHADKIVAAFEGIALDPRELEFIGRLKTALRGARLGSGVQPYLTLGFNPDCILYRSAVFPSLPVVSDTVEARRAYLLHIYFRSLQLRPWDFVAKWSREFLYLYRPEHRHFFQRSIYQRHEYASTGNQAWLGDPQMRPPGPPWLHAALEDYRIRVQQAEAVSPKEYWTCVVRPKIYKKYGIPFLKALAWALGPILIGIPLLSVCCARRFADLRRGLGFGCVGVAFSLGAACTVAVAHSFSIERYSAVLLFLHALLLAVGGALGALLVERIVVWVGQHLPLRSHGEDSLGSGVARQ